MLYAVSAVIGFVAGAFLVLKLKNYDAVRLNQLHKENESLRHKLATSHLLLKRRFFKKSKSCKNKNC